MFFRLKPYSISSKIERLPISRMFTILIIIGSPKSSLIVAASIVGRSFMLEKWKKQFITDKIIFRSDSKSSEAEFQISDSVSLQKIRINYMHLKAIFQTATFGILLRLLDTYCSTEQWLLNQYDVQHPFPLYSTQFRK
jgi:hypothetical protein